MLTTNNCCDNFLVLLAGEAQYSELANVLCPISGEVMKDPVLADDGQNYERKQIKFWFQNCQEKQNLIESPWTRVVISTQLRENPKIQAKVAVAAPKRTMVTGLKGVTTLHNLYDVFAQLDNLC